METNVSVRPSTPADIDAVAAFSFALWPDDPLASHRAEVAAKVSGPVPSTLPLTILVAEVDGAVVGFVEVGLRSHADGCDTTHPVGFIEGWYAAPEHQRHGVGRALIAAAETWSRSHGCREMASDTWIDHEDAQRAHEGVGFEVVDRCVHYKKSIGG
jgi:aminoglycoside 6'-N-acetyltransferase I